MAGAFRDREHRKRTRLYGEVLERAKRPGRGAWRSAVGMVVTRTTTTYAFQACIRGGIAPLRRCVSGWAPSRLMQQVLQALQRTRSLVRGDRKALGNHLPRDLADLAWWWRVRWVIARSEILPGAAEFDHGDPGCVPDRRISQVDYTLAVNFVGAQR